MYYPEICYAYGVYGVFQKHQMISVMFQLPPIKKFYTSYYYYICYHFTDYVHFQECSKWSDILMSIFIYKVMWKQCCGDFDGCGQICHIERTINRTDSRT